MKLFAESNRWRFVYIHSEGAHEFLNRGEGLLWEQKDIYEVLEVKLGRNEDSKFARTVLKEKNFPQAVTWGCWRPRPIVVLSLGLVQIPGDNLGNGW